MHVQLEAWSSTGAGVQVCNCYRSRGMAAYRGRGKAARGATGSSCCLSKETSSDGSPLWATWFLSMSLQRRLRLSMVGVREWGQGLGCYLVISVGTSRN